MQIKNVFFACLVSMALGAAGALYLRPNLERTVEVTKDVFKTDVKTVIHYKERPDGTKESVTTIIDNSKQTSSTSNTQEKPVQKNWLVGASVASKWDLQPIYGVQVNRRILGPVYIGLTANTQAELGLVVALEF